MNDAPDNNPDELVAGKYRLARMIGQGGMGSVWEGEHISLGTRVAVKFIETELAESEEARERFDKEARAAAKLQSRYVVGVYDHGVMPDGRPFIVMEYLHGETLEERVVGQGRLDLVETALIISQVARGLAKAHELGIVHRDLKPENIFLTESPDGDEQVAKVVDFGIAKFTEGAPVGMSSSTRTGTLLGTPVYMSPEQARGLRDIDHRSDLWALGVLVYRCVVGELPFEGQAVGDIVVKICTQDPVPPTEVIPSLPAALDDWFRRCVAREREERFDSAKELAAELMVVAGLVAHADQAFATTNAVSAPGSNGRRMGMTPLPVQAASSKVDIENAATQMGATTPVPLNVKSRPLGVLGVVFAIVGAVAVVGGLAAWRHFAPPQGLDPEPATPNGALSHPAAGEPSPTSTLDGTDASLTDSEPREAASAESAESAFPPDTKQPPAPPPPGRTPPTRKDSKPPKPPKPPPASTDTVDLGY